MIEIKEPFSLQLNEIPGIDADLSDILFFDIETTGLSPYSSACYLIGAVYYEAGQFYVHQWFSPSFASEQEILRAFFAFSRRFQVLLHFNGDTFDIRYLEGAAKQYGIPCPLTELQSFDLLKAIRKRKKLLGLPNCKQKSVEQFLGIEREDRFSGGELISVYETYTKSRDPELLEILLLHNADDLRGMPHLLPVLNYGEALTSEFRIVSYLRNRSGTRLFLTAEFDFSFPVPLDYELNEDISLHFEGQQLRCQIRMEYRELKYFYSDYKNYYYLLKEDYAIHKKVAAFVEKEYRVKATPETCYQRVEGFFLPYLLHSDLPVFTDAYRSSLKRHNFEPNEAFSKRYLSEVLKSMR